MSLLARIEKLERQSVHDDGRCHCRYPGLGRITFPDGIVMGNPHCPRCGGQRPAGLVIWDEE